MSKAASNEGETSALVKHVFGKLDTMHKLEKHATASRGSTLQSDDLKRKHGHRKTHKAKGHAAAGTFESEGNIFKSYADAEERRLRTGQSLTHKKVRLNSADLKRRVQILGRRALMARIQGSMPAYETRGNSRDKDHDVHAHKLSKAVPGWVWGDKVVVHGQVMSEVKVLNKMLQKAEKEEEEKTHQPQPRKVRTSMIEALRGKGFDSMNQAELFGMGDDDEEEEEEVCGADPSDTALAQFAEFVIEMGNGTLRGAFEIFDSNSGGRVNAWDFTEYLKDHGFVGDPEALFRALDNEERGWIGLRDFQKLGPFMALVQENATRRRNSLEKSSLELMKALEKGRGEMSRQMEMPRQTSVAELPSPAAEVSVESKTSSPQRGPLRSVVGPVRIKLFTNATPNHTGVSCFVGTAAKPAKDMKALFQLCDRVCRPMGGPVRLLYDQRLRVIRDPAALKDGCSYLACGMEPLSPPPLFLKDKFTPLDYPMAATAPSLSRASTAPVLNARSHLHSEPSYSNSRAATAPLSQSQVQSLGASSWGQWQQLHPGKPLREPRPSSGVPRLLMRKVPSSGGQSAASLAGEPESWGFAAAPSLL